MKSYDSMSLPFVYTENQLISHPGSLIQLDTEESFHLSRVLRLKKGNKVLLTDGKGYLVECEIVESDTRETMLQMTESPQFHQKNQYSVHIAIAPTKHPDRLEWFIEKAVETGIDKISLIICEHSEKWNVKIPRLKRLMISAMKQSQQSWLPELSGPTDFKAVIAQSSEIQRYIGYCEGDPILLTHQLQAGKSVVVAIGPEGDFSPAEIDSAQKNGFIPISLGPTRLRTETAGLVASLTINTMNSIK